MMNYFFGNKKIKMRGDGSSNSKQKVNIDKVV